MNPLAVATLLVSLTAVCAAQDPAIPEPDADGWIALFDGKTTCGWTATGGELRVEQGVLTLTSDGKEASMTPAIEHRDYELQAEYDVRAELLAFAEVTLENGDDSASVGMMGTAGSTLHLAVFEATGSQGSVVYTNSKVASQERSTVRSWFVHVGAGEDLSPVLRFRTTAAGAELRLRNVHLRPLKPGDPLDLPPALQIVKPRNVKPRPTGDDTKPTKEPQP